jgi:tetratricopeptide (TPR) repeat protein
MEYSMEIQQRTEDISGIRFFYAGKILLFILVGLLPVWFIPSSINIEMGREVTLGILIFLGAICWLLAVLGTGEIRYHRSLLLFAAFLLLFAAGTSVIFSPVPFVSLFFADALAERFLTLLLGVVLFLLTSNLLRTEGDVMLSSGILLAAGTAAGIITLLRFAAGVSVWGRFFSFAAPVEFNVIGTINGLAVFFSVLLVMAVALVAANRPLPEGKAARWIRPLAFLAIIVFLGNLLFINFRMAWIILLGSSIFLFGLMFKEGAASPRRMDSRQWMTVMILALAVAMVMFQVQPFKGLGAPTEISPNLGATWSVAKAVFKEGPRQLLFGTGPGTFSLVWSQWRDPSINQSVFWGIRFHQGFSWVSTLLSTTGFFGFAAFLFYLGVGLFLFIRRVLTSSVGENPLVKSFLAGSAALGIAAFLYPANLSLLLLLFFSFGALAFLLRAEGARWWELGEHAVRFEMPWAVFLSSLTAVFLISLAVAGVYFEANRLRASLLQQKGIAELNRGDLDASISSFERASGLEDGNFRNYQMLVQARIEKIRELIRRAAGGENVQQDFQSAVSLAIRDSEKTVELHPRESTLWRLQGTLYELIIPFIQGSERFAFSAYDRAAEFDPLNPSIFVEKGRAGLVFADRIQFVQNQVKAEDREGFERERAAAIEDAEAALKKAVEVKPDLAAAHFLLAQAALRRGSITSAIQNAENAKLAAPFDTGVGFQLGLLYYQQNEFGRAREEFERVVSLNPNYSNARYFLGLIYDRGGEKERAIGEFEKIRQLNADNQEVEKILDNLRSGKSALASIVPPQKPPEERKELPLGEREEGPARDKKR